MHFGRKLLEQRYGAWQDKYLDYNQLKSVLEDPAFTLPDDEEAGEADEVLLLSTNSNVEGDAAPIYQHQVELNTSTRSLTLMNTNTALTLRHLHFIGLLNDQVEGVVHFFLQQQGLLATNLIKLTSRLHKVMAMVRQNPQLLGSTTLSVQDEYELLSQEYQAAAQTLFHLVRFVDLNVTGVRKILKKHDKLMPFKLSAKYLGSTGQTTTTTTISQQQTAVLRPLLEDGGLEALYVSLQNALEDLSNLYWQLLSTEVMKDDGATSKLWLEHASSTVSESASPSTSRYKDALMAASPTLSLSEHGAMSPDYHSILQSTLPTPFIPVSPTSVFHEHQRSRSSPHNQRTHLLLLQIQAARQRLQHTSQFVRMLAAPVLLDQHFDSDEALLEEEEVGGGAEDFYYTTKLSTRYLPTDLKRRRRLSNWLNYCSTFLHMTDYYIVAPTSGLYAERLGDTAALAGLIIGLNSVSALVSTILYSWWTSYSYRHAIVFASCCQLLGCLVYASALPCQSLTMVIVGRLIGGFGSARSINRRYIADTYPLQERTAASAGFVTAGALGTSLGPAAAAGLYLFVPETSANPYWQIVNAPGWTMACLWTIYVVLLIFYFEDPPKTVAQRQKRQAARQANSNNKIPSEVMAPKESQPLLSGNPKDTIRSALTMDDDDKDMRPLWKIVPVIMTFLIYFTLKFILESLLSSTAILTDYYFDWNGSISGMYMAFLGLLVLPANWIIAVGSQYYDDRELIMATQICMFLGCLAIMHLFTAEYSPLHYLLGSIVVFVSANALEGPNMSLLSKTIPPRYSRGIFNVGLLATESGNLGRATGDMILTLCGSHGLGHILNNAFGLMSVLSATTISLTYFVYDQLEPFEKD